MSDVQEIELKEMLLPIEKVMVERFDSVDKRLEKISLDIEAMDKVTRFRALSENIERMSKELVSR